MRPRGMERGLKGGDGGGWKGSVGTVEEPTSMLSSRIAQAMEAEAREGGGQQQAGGSQMTGEDFVQGQE